MTDEAAMLFAGILIFAVGALFGIGSALRGIADELRAARRREP